MVNSFREYAPFRNLITAVGGAMKRLILLFVLLNVQLFSQSWYLDFGSNVNTWGDNPSEQDAESTTFLPPPHSTQETPSSGISWVYVGLSGGEFQLVNPGILGDGSELRGFASSNQSANNINKCSVYDYIPSDLFSISFSIRFEGGTCGNCGHWYFFSGDGPYFSNRERLITYPNKPRFVGVKWVFATDTTMLTYFREPTGNWVGPHDSLIVTRSTNYRIEIFGNNSNSKKSYDYNSTIYNLASATYDVWLDGVKVVTGQPSAELPVGNMDSFMFFGEGPGDNTAAIYVEDIMFSNTLELNPVPVELTYFTARQIENIVKLEWKTETEINNYGFDIERSFSDNNNWEKIGFVEGHGTTTFPEYYSFTDDNSLSPGEYHYRLKQTDYDGTFEYSPQVKVTLGSPTKHILNQNFPNPFNPSTRISYSIPEKSNVSLRVYDILGNEVVVLVNGEKEAGTYEVEFNGENMSNGIYFYRLQTESFTEIKKMVFMK